MSLNIKTSTGLLEISSKVDTSYIDAQLATKANSDHTHEQYLTAIPDEYITETKLDAKGYVTETELNAKGYVTMNDASGLATQIHGEIAEMYVSKTDAENTYATKTELNDALTSAEAQLQEIVTNIGAEFNNYLTKTDAADTYATKTDLDTKVNTSLIYTGDGTEQPIQDQLLPYEFINSVYATKEELSDYLTSDDISNLATVGYVNANIPSYITTGAMAGTTIGECATAEGADTTASGAYSHAEGLETVASGYVSHAGGIGTIANDYQYVVGRYNANTTAPTTLTDTATSTGLFIVGIGSSDTARSNGFRVSASGKVYGTGVFGTSGADYAEYFEWFDGNPNNEDRRGRFVTLDGGKIRYATSNDDYILGVVSANPSVAGDIQSESWHNMYLKDIYGSKLVEVVEVEETTNENGEIIPAHTESRWVLNPDYNPDVKYISREERPEWAAIGIVGKLVVVDDGTCQVNGYCYPNVDGIVTASQEKTNYRVMERLDDTHIRIFIK